MAKPNIAALLGPFVVRQITPELATQIEAYLALLAKWNRTTNLTAIRVPEQIIERHFGEAFFAAERLLSPADVTVMDLGSGAGFPGLPMAMLAPAAKFTLVEAQAKKATFLKEVVRHLGLKNVKVFAGRAEEYALTADLVTMRAVERFVDMVPVAVGRLAPEGRLALFSTEECFALLTEAAHREGLRIVATHRLPRSRTGAIYVLRRDPEA